MMTPLARIPSRRARSLLGLLPLVLGFSVASGVLFFHGHATTVSSGSVPLDSRLVLRPHVVTVTGKLSHRISFRLTMYPALPGPNTLRATVPRTVHLAPRIAVIGRMIGMAMPPSRGFLVRRGTVYTGTINMTMFGRYWLSTTAHSASVNYSGGATVPIALPSQ